VRWRELDCTQRPYVDLDVESRKVARLVRGKSSKQSL